MHLVTISDYQNRFTALFPGPPRSAGARRELLVVMVKLNGYGKTKSNTTKAHVHQSKEMYFNTKKTKSQV